MIVSATDTLINPFMDSPAAPEAKTEVLDSPSSAATFSMNGDFTEDHAVSIIHWIEARKNASHIRLQGNEKKVHPNAFQQIMQALITQSPNLQELEISHHRLGLAGIKILAPFLLRFKSIKALILSFNKINDVELRFLSDYLAKSQIVRLDLASNNFKSAALTYLLSKTASLPAIALDLSRNHLGDSGMSAILAAAEAGHLRTVIGLNICENDVSAAGAEVLSKSFKNLQNIRTFNISINDINDSGVESISAALREFPPPNFMFLHVIGVGMTTSGARSLSLALPHLQNLVDLDLGFNEIGDAGFKALSSTLPAPITTMHFSDCKLTDASVPDLAHTIQTHPQIQTVGLTWNDFTDDGIITLMRTVIPSKVKSLEVNNLPHISGVPPDAFPDETSQGQYPMNSELLLQFIRDYPLHYASAIGDRDAVRHHLSSTDFDPNLRDKLFCETPLFFAARGRRDEVITLLVQEYGASLNVKNAKGESAADVAVDVAENAFMEIRALSRKETREKLEEMILTGADERPGEMIKSAAKRFRPILT